MQHLCKKTLTVLVIPALLLWGCVPVPPDQGGSIPPPDIDPGGSPDVPNVNDNGSSGGALIFDVTMQAASIFVTNIDVPATLTLTENTGPDAGDFPYSTATLRDNFNSIVDPSDREVGFSGGIGLIATREASFGDTAFVMRAQRDGVVQSSLSGSGTNRNGFILPAGSSIFIPGELGVTFEAIGGSTFSFRVEGGSVSGSVDLSGSPITDFSSTDVYIGTFAGTLRR